MLDMDTAMNDMFKANGNLAAAEKYDGMVQTSYTGNIFRAIVTLSYQGVSVE